jgi:hypothetical protein
MRLSRADRLAPLNDAEGWNLMACPALMRQQIVPWASPEMVTAQGSVKPLPALSQHKML